MFKYMCKTLNLNGIDLSNHNEGLLMHFVNNQENEVWGDYPTEIRLNDDGDWFIYFEDTDCVVYKEELEINSEEVWSNLACVLCDMYDFNFNYHNFEIGDKVYWNDPAINDYPEDEREDALKRRFVVIGIEGKYDDSIITITDCYTDAEVYPNELVKIN